ETTFSSHLKLTNTNNIAGYFVPKKRAEAIQPLPFNTRLFNQRLLLSSSHTIPSFLSDTCICSETQHFLRNINKRYCICNCQIFSSSITSSCPFLCISLLFCQIMDGLKITTTVLDFLDILNKLF